MDILLNVNDTIYFKIKLQLKFIKNKIYYSKIVNFHTAFFFTVALRPNAGHGLLILEVF